MCLEMVSQLIPSMSNKMQIHVHVGKYPNFQSGNFLVIRTFFHPETFKEELEGSTPLTGAQDTWVPKI